MMFRFLKMAIFTPFALWAMDDLVKEFNDHKTKGQRMLKPGAFIEKCFDTLDKSAVEASVLPKTIEMYMDLLTDSKNLNFKKAFSPYNSAQQNKHLDAIAKIFAKIDKKSGYAKTNYQELYRTVANANYKKAALKEENKEKYVRHLEWLRLFFWQADAIKDYKIYNGSVYTPEILNGKAVSLISVGNQSQYDWTINKSLSLKSDFCNSMIRSSLIERYLKASTPVRLMKNEFPLYDSQSEKDQTKTKDYIDNVFSAFSSYQYNIQMFYTEQYRNFQEMGLSILRKIKEKSLGDHKKFDLLGTIRILNYGLSNVSEFFEKDIDADSQIDGEKRFLTLKVTNKPTENLDYSGLKWGYYAALGLKKEASQDDIKKTYRKLAMQYHPDKNPGDAHAEYMSKQINEAYSVLSDPEERKLYNEVCSRMFSRFRDRDLNKSVEEVTSEETFKTDPYDLPDFLYP